MGFYSRIIFPRFYDCLVDKPFWGKYRQQQLASVHGEILEIGVGTGLNLPHYPSHVRKITTVDPNPGKTMQQLRNSSHTNTLGRVSQKFKNDRGAKLRACRLN